MHPRARPGQKQDEAGEVSVLVSSLQHIAEGYYLRGALLQPDTPQMWKKAYDVIVLRHNQQEDEYEPGDAANVLKNM